MTQHVIISSKNPVKINAVKTAFLKMFSGQEFSFEGISVSSGVADQPMSDDETFSGSKNRAENAKVSQPQADYWVGLEGGIEQSEKGMECFAWMYVLSNDQVGYARTSSFFLPKEVAELINQGKELGEADDIVFGRSNSKQANGAVGLLTNDLITRTTYYDQALILALIPFANEELY